MAPTFTTADELLRAQDIGRCELVRGELRSLIPPGAEHGRVAMRLGVAVANHVDAKALGTAFAAETGFLLAHDPDTVRAPDLAVEVLSPDDRPGYVREKVAEWLEADALDGGDVLPGFSVPVARIFA
jgi:Uma2 family endonuclease